MKKITVNDVLTKEEYKPYINYIKGIAKGFSKFYSFKDPHLVFEAILTPEDLAQVCYLKLWDLEKIGELDNCINAKITFINKKTGKTQNKFPLLGTIMANHLKDYMKEYVDDPVYGAASLDITYSESGDPMPIQNTNLKHINYKAPREGKKQEGRPYIPIETLSAPRLLFSRYITSKTVIHLNDGFIQVANESFDNDVIDRISLMENAKEVLKKLDTLRESAFRKKLYIAELFTGYHAYIPINPMRDIKSQKINRRNNIKQLAEILNTYTNKVKRHGLKLYQIKQLQKYKWRKQIYIDLGIDQNSPEFREFEAYWRAFKTGESQPY